MEKLGEGTSQLSTITPPDDGNPQISVSECVHPLASSDVNTSADLLDTNTCKSSDNPSVPSPGVQQAHWSSLSCEGYDEVDNTTEEKYSENEKKLIHTSAVQGCHNEEIMQTKISLKHKMNTAIPPESLKCYSQEDNTSSQHTAPNKDSCDEKVINSVTSEHSFGEKILKAWTNGIMTISTNPNLELREKSGAVTSPKLSENVEALLHTESTLVESSIELPQAEDGSDDISISKTPADVEVPPGSLPPLLLRPSRTIFTCEEREEHLLQDSDSELEMTPGCELQVQVSDSHTHICSEGAESIPPITKESLELPVDGTDCLQPPPPPPPPPPPLPLPKFQHSLSKRDTMLHPCTDTTPKVEPPTAKCGSGFGLQSFFGAIQPVRPLHSTTLCPLGTLKLSLKPKVASVCTQLQPEPNELSDRIRDELNEQSHQELNKQSPEPPSKKKPRLMGNNVIPMGEGSVTCGKLTCAVTKEYTCEIEMYPLPGSQHPNRHQNSMTAISTTDQLQQTRTPEATVPTMLTSPEAELDVISKFEPEYPHQPSDSADDGQDTMYQAVPTECARDHALVPNMVPCGNESENRSSRDDHDDTSGGNELEVPVDQQILGNNRQTSQDDGQMAVSEVPYLDEQEEHLSSQEMSQVPKATLSLTEASPSPMYTVLTSEHSTEAAPSLLTLDHHQLVPDDPLNSSFTIHSLYEQPESVKEQKSDSKLCSNLEDADIDELDGPTVVAMALESIEMRHKGVIEEGWEQVPQPPIPHRSSAFTLHQISSGDSVQKNHLGKYAFEFVCL